MDNIEQLEKRIEVLEERLAQLAELTATLVVHEGKTLQAIAKLEKRTMALAKFKAPLPGMTPDEVRQQLNEML